MTKKILLIDDSEFILESTFTLLEFAGYEVISATNGAMGLEKAKSELPDLIICDVSMPGMSGFEVVSAVRADPSIAHTPFIFLTAFTEKTKMREGIERGADDYLTKPFTKKELIAAVDTQWKRASKVDVKIQGEVANVGKKLNYALPHEFQTVISQLMGSANDIKNNVEYLEKEDIVEVCDQMLTICARLKRITDNFLLFTKLENYSKSPEALEELRSGKTDEPFAMFIDLAETISARFDRLGDIEKQNDTSEISIAMNSDLFHKLSDEFIDNALKFSKKGTKVTIDSKLEGNMLWISITDEGVGMAPEQIKNITAFVQFEREEKEQQGVGIGLSIAKKIVELHNGSFDVTSEKDKGTTIIFTIPLR